jgi:hypothetical protein
MAPMKPAARKPGRTLEKCGVCRELKVLGNCGFGRGNPYIISALHCRACCTPPDRAHWRSLAAIEGKSASSESSVRRILRRYASVSAGLLGLVTDLACGQAIHNPRRAT